MIIEYYGDFAIHEQWYTCARFRFFVKEWIKWTSQVHLHYLFLQGLSERMAKVKRFLWALNFTKS